MKPEAASDDETIEQPLVVKEGAERQLHDPFPPGTVVGHFRIMRRIGHGGMGEVHLARDLELGRKVALKLVHPKQFDSPETMRRFMVEARMTARFNHPNIVTLYQVGEHEGRPYLALEYLEGEDLGARMADRALSVREVVRIGLAIAEALVEAHRHGVLHRDLKPGNVMIGHDGRVRVLDFGLSKALEPSVPPSMRDGAPPSMRDWALQSQHEGVPPDSARGAWAPKPGEQQSWGMGTPRYMAPEQWREQECTPASDVWALGVVLYAMLGRKLPFEKRLLTDQAWAVCNEPAPPIEGLAAAVPDELAELVHACLAKDPSARPPASAAVETLAALVGGRAHRARADASPFRGLLPFGTEHADRFFGRDGEIASFVERLRTEPLLPVLGPSGAGKSSFIRAGIVPRLLEQESWLVLSMRPGSRPFDALASRLLRGDRHSTARSSTRRRADIFDAATRQSLKVDASVEQVSLPDISVPGAESGLAVGGSAAPPPQARIDDPDAVADLAALLEKEPARLGMELRAQAEAHESRVLLFVDQLEELFTLSDDHVGHAAFLESIASATDDPLDPVRVVFTVRDDFLGRLATSAHMRDVLSHVTVIQRPDADALREILVQPVAQMGYRYEDNALVDEMVDAVSGEPACLPLLQFAAHLLWEARDQSKRLITRSAYESVGGVAGALARHADGVLAVLLEDDVRVAREILLRLVTPDRTRRVMAREQVLYALGAKSKDVLTRLTEARLVTTSKVVGEAGVVTMLELAHESLITTWSRLSRWLDESRDDLAFLTEVGQVAELWDRRGRRREELWQGDALRECERSVARVTQELPALVRDFVEASRERDRRRAIRRRLGYLSAVVLLAAAAVGATLLAVFVRGQRDQARAQRVEALRDGARAALERGHVLEARAKLREALEGEDSTIGRALWWRLAHEPLVWLAHTASPAYAVAQSKDTVAATSQDGPVYLFDVATARQRILRGHGDQVLSVAFSPSGDLLASGSLDKTVRIWNVASGQLVRVLIGHESGVHGVAFSADGKLLAAGGYDQTARLFDVATGEQRRVLEGHTAAVRGVAFDPSGSLLATAGADRTARIWNLTDGRERVSLGGHEREVYSVAFSPDGAQLVSGSYDGRLRVWSVAGGKLARVLEGHAGGISNIVFDASGTRLASAGSDRTARLWDIQRGTELRRLEHDAMVTGVALSHDGALLATSTTAGSVSLWDLRVASMHDAAAAGHGAPVSGADLSPDGRWVVSGGFDARIRIWSVETGRVERVLSGHQDAVGDVAFSPDGRLVASGGKDMTLRLWDAATGEPGVVLTGHRAEIRGVVFSPDGKLLATASYDQTARIWDAVEGKTLAVLEGHGDRVPDAAFSPDSKMVATSGYDRKIRLWDVASGKAIRALEGHEHRVYGVSFSSDGLQLASGSYDKTVRLWDVASGTGRVLGAHPGRVYDLQFHPTAARIAAPCSDGNIRIWNVDDGGYVELRGHRNEANTVRFSRDGALLVSASDDGTVRLWRTDNGRPVWRGPALLMLGGTALAWTHRGWQTTDGQPTRPPEALWRSEIENDARYSSQSPDGSALCIQRFDGKVSLLDVATAARRAEHSMPGAVGVLAFDGGCIAHDGKQAVVVSDGGVTELSVDGPVHAIGGGDGELLVATDAHVLRFDRRGGVLGRHGIEVGVTAVSMSGGRLMLGYGDGSLDVVPTRDGGDRPSFSFEKTPASSVELVMPGPLDTVIAGYGNGLLGLWDGHSGIMLAHISVHGPITHVVASAGQLHVGSDLGQVARWDLSPFFTDYCELMRELWQRIGTVWRAGSAVVEAPPADHRCRAR